MLGLGAADAVFSHKSGTLESILSRGNGPVYVHMHWDLLAHFKSSHT